MKAVIITRPGGPEVLEIKEVSDPHPADSELLVRVHATAVNRADLLQCRGRYPAPTGTRNDIPGLEFAGEIVELGPLAHGFQTGQRVMGLLPGEGYAQFVSIPAQLALPVPESWTYEEAASIPEAFLTAYDALFLQLHLKRGESVLIHACGSGVGTAAVQLAHHRGARVFGTAGSDEKLSRARNLGLDVGINYRTQDFSEIVLRETEQHGVDVLLDLVGAAHWNRSLRASAQRGRIIVVGLVSGSHVELDLRTLMGKQLSVVGTVLRARRVKEKGRLVADFRKSILPHLESGAIRPVVDRVYPWNQVSAAHAYIEQNRNFGKIVLAVA